MRMAQLSFQEKATFEDLFGMSSGYVIDFSNNSFARFIGELVNIDIYAGDEYQAYCSKAEKLRQIWNNEPDFVVGTLLDALLTYFVDYKDSKGESWTAYEERKTSEMRTVCQRLIGNVLKVDLSKKQEETLQTLLDDINNSLARNQPTLVLDRLHTFSTKLLRDICKNNGISVVNNKGDYLPLHSLAGSLKKYYEQNPVFQSTFTTLAIQNSISLFDEYNNIRNNQSYAHDNILLDAIEASFVVKTMANLITFIDNIENHRKNKPSQKMEENNVFDIPF
jgi:hypothetical protein